MPSRGAQFAVAFALVMIFGRSVALAAPPTAGDPVVAPPTHDESDADRPAPSARPRAAETPVVTAPSTPPAPIVAPPPAPARAAPPVVAPPSGATPPIATHSDADGSGCVNGFDASGAPCSISAGSEPPSRKSTAHLHDGFFFRAGLGVSIYSGRTSDTASRARAGGVFEALFGGTPWRGVVIGGGVLAQTDASLLGYHGFIQYYPNPRTGFHIQGLVGIAIAEDGANHSAGTRTPVGPIAAAGVGYDFWSSAQTSFGVFARLGVTRVSYFAADGGSSATSDPVTSFGNIVGTFTLH